MPEGDTITRKGGMGSKLLLIALGILGTGLASTIDWVGRSFDAKIAETQKENAALHKRLDAVEAAEAKWGTFAEIKQDTIRLREAQAYERGRVDTLLAIVGATSPAERKSAQRPKMEAPPPLPPNPKVLQRIDPDEFRAAQQQKYQFKGKK